MVYRRVSFSKHRWVQWSGKKQVNFANSMRSCINGTNNTDEKKQLLTELLCVQISNKKPFPHLWEHGIKGGLKGNKCCRLGSKMGIHKFKPFWLTCRRIQTMAPPVRPLPKALAPGSVPPRTNEGAVCGYGLTLNWYLRGREKSVLRHYYWPTPLNRCSPIEKGFQQLEIYFEP